MLPGSVVLVPALSVTATVKVNVPVVVGVPESPAGAEGLSVSPGGSCPAGIDQVWIAGRPAVEGGKYLGLRGGARLAPAS